MDRSLEFWQDGNKTTGEPGHIIGQGCNPHTRRCRPIHCIEIIDPQNRLALITVVSTGPFSSHCGAVQHRSHEESDIDHESEQISLRSNVRHVLWSCNSEAPNNSQLAVMGRPITALKCAAQTLGQHSRCGELAQTFLPPRQLDLRQLPRLQDGASWARGRSRKLCGSHGNNWC